MKLTQRLLLGAVAVVGFLVVFIVVVVSRQLSQRLRDETTQNLAREARFVATQWTPASDPSALAHAAGQSLGRRVTLIREDGVVIGDTDFDEQGLRRLENHRSRPEVADAMAGRGTLLVDGGIRRGTDVLKALALGASAVFIGRPYVWGMAAFGQPGVERVLQLMQIETRAAMMQCGVRNVKELLALAKSRPDELTYASSGLLGAPLAVRGSKEVAVRTLDRLGDPAAIPALEEIANDASNPASESAKQAVESLKKKQTGGH